VDVAALLISLAAMAVALVALARTERRAAEPTESVPAQPSPGTPRVTRSEPAPSPPDRPQEVSPGHRGVHFELLPLGESVYQLRNYGTAPAFAVRVKAHRLGKNASYDEFPAGHSEEHELHPSDRGSNIVEITWHARADKSDAIQHKRLRLNG
jgi:hypothetical protein